MTVERALDWVLATASFATLVYFAANAQEDIEKEMGGPIEEAPETYLDRAVVTHVDEIAASGVKGVVLVHGLGGTLHAWYGVIENLSGCSDDEEITESATEVNGAVSGA
mgnify:CR=1 FL=1